MTFCAIELQPISPTTAKLNPGWIRSASNGDGIEDAANEGLNWKYVVQLTIKNATNIGYTFFKKLQPA